MVFQTRNSLFEKSFFSGNNNELFSFVKFTFCWHPWEIFSLNKKNALSAFFWVSIRIFFQRVGSFKRAQKSFFSFGKSLFFFLLKMFSLGEKSYLDRTFLCLNELNSSIKCLRETQVFMSNSEIQENFNIYLLAVFC